MRAGNGHLDEGTIVRLLDGEIADGERRVAEAHLADCPACRASRERVAKLSRAFTGWVALADPEDGADPERVPAPRGGRSWISSVPLLRVAAAIALLAGVALALPPALRWARDQSSDTRPGEEEALPGPGSVTVSFAPVGDRLAIRVEKPQRGGRIRLRPGEGPNVEARVVGGTGLEELLVLPEGVAVRNLAGSTADYEVEVPATLAGVDLVVAGRVVWAGSPGDLPVERDLSVR